MISLTYRTVDGVNRSRDFKTIVNAQKYAEFWLGKTPEVFKDSTYAVSFDGIATMTWSGCEPQQLWPTAFAS